MNFRVKLAVRAVKIRLKRGEYLESILSHYKGLTVEEKTYIRSYY